MRGSSWHLKFVLVALLAPSAGQALMAEITLSRSLQSTAAAAAASSAHEPIITDHTACGVPASV